MVKTNKQLVEKCIDIAKNYKTLYVMGCFGAPMNSKNKTRYINNGAHGSYNAKSTRKKMIQAATNDTFGFDCVCLIKGILWDWCGDKTKNYGGATYASNNVPDIDADQMINVCKGVSTDFSKIEIGEAVWLKGHIGVYIGDGLAVECTPSWKNCVQITACNCNKNGYNRRNWTKHGKLPYITYEKAVNVPENANNETKGNGTMRYFELLDEMNIRKTPNGTKIGTAPKGAVISGTEFGKSGNTTWLKTTYNGISGYICVLPESKGYAKEVSAPTTDYKALYETEKNRADALQAKLNKIKELVL
jgi:hypothetical protein